MAKNKTVKKKTSSKKQLKPSVPTPLEKTQSETDLIVKDIVQMKNNRVPHNEIIETLANQYRKAPSTIQRHMRTASKQLKEAHIRDMVDLKTEYASSLNESIREAYNNYKKYETIGEMEISLKWYKMYMDLVKVDGDFRFKGEQPQQQTNIQINIDKDDEGL